MKVQVAAAVGLNITNHKAHATIAGNLSAKTLRLLADNDGNFRTRASGAAMSLANSANSIAAGVAISVNNNEAVAHIRGTITTDTTNPAEAALPELRVQAQLTQNMDGEYRGALGAQALAGSVSGTNAKATVSGAIAIIVSHAKTSAVIADGSKLTGADIEISAFDQSKLALRAGGLSISKGSQVGIGASSALVYGENTVEAKIGDGVTIRGASLTLSAEKKAVTFADFTPTVGLDTLLTDSTGLAAGSYTPGIIDIKKDTTASNKGYTVTINISTDTILSAIDLLNFLSSNNYYAEAIAGAISGGTGGTLSLAGSMAMIFYKAATRALIGQNVTVDVIDAAAVTAQDHATARIISGSISSAPAKAGVGFTLSTLNNESAVEAVVEDGTNIAAGSYTQSAEVNNDFMVITIAAAVSTNSSGATVGGTVNVVVMENDVLSRFGKGVIRTRSGDVNISAKADTYLLMPSLSVSVSGGKAAVGGTISVIVAGSRTIADVLAGAELISAGAAAISAVAKDKFVSALGSVSAAPSGSGAVAAAVNVLVATAETRAKVGNGATVSAAGNAAITAESDLWMFVLGMSASGASKAGVGASVIVNVLNRTTEANLGKGAKLIATDGSALVQALGEDWVLIIGFAMGAGGTAGIAGVLPVTVSNSTVRAAVQETAVVTAGDSIGVIANLDSGIYIAAGAFGAGNTAGVGMAVSTAVLQNTIEALVKQGAMLNASGKVAGLPVDAGIQVPNRAARRRGIVVHASGTEDMLMISISGAAAGNGAGAGVINTLVAKNTVRAKVDGSTLNASGSEISYQITAEDGKQQKITTSSDVCVEASDEALILDLAGGLAAGSTAGVGATVVVLVFNKTVEAALSGTIAATGDVSVTANAEDALYLLALAFGTGGTAGVAGGANALVFENSTTAALGGMVVKANDVLVSATADSRLYNIAAGVAGGGTAAVTAVAVVTYFKNTTAAYLAEGTVIGTAASPVTGDVAVLANSYEFVTADAVGMSGGGTAGVGGTLDVLVTLVKTSAFTGNNVAVYAAGDVNVRAVDEYGLIAVVVTIAGSGTAAVGVTALVSVSFNTITTVIGETNTIVGKSFTLLASSNRDVVSTVATVAGSGVAGVGVSLSVVVSGNKMSQDAHDSLYQDDGSQLTITRDGTLYLVYDHAYEASGETVHVTVYEAPDGKLYRMDSNGNLVSYTVDKAKLTKATASNLDPQAQLDGAFKLGHSSARANKPGESLNDLLAGDGQRGGEEDYNSYGQDTSGQIYVLSNGKYIPVTDEEYESKYNGQQRYLYNSRTKQYEKTSKSASENQQFGSGEDGRANAPDGSQFDSAAEGFGYSSAALDGLKDSTTAEVMGKGTAIRAVGGDINVLAADAVSAVMVSGTVAIGGTGAGVGVGLSSSTFFSNVEALVQSGAILRASGDVNVKASSGASEDVLAPLDKEVEGGTVSQSSVKAELQNQGVDEVNESSALYLISFTAGGGFVGVGVGAATLLVFTQVKAILAGDIAGAQNVNVEGGMDFGRVLTVTSGVSGGAVAVNVSLGATHFGGSVETAIAGSAWLRDVGGSINVKTSGKTNVITAAGTIAGGAVAVNAGVAIATNITEVHTYIGQGVVVDAPEANINLSTAFEANANASIIAITGGAVAVGASVAISVNRLSAQTYIGTTPQGTAQSGAASPEKGRIAAGAVCVESNVQGTSSVYGASIAGGAVTVNGIVALAFNRAAGIAAVNQANLDAASLSVLAQMAGDVIVRTVAATGGGVAVGATVAVAEQKTDNRALIDASGSRLSISGDIMVSAGTEATPYNSDATVTSITGAAGAVAVAMNFAVAANEAGNRALVQGVSGTLNARSLIIEAHGNAHAYVVVGNAAAGSIAANVSFAYANLISKQEAMLSGSATLVLTGSLTVRARQNQDEVTGSLLLDYQGSSVDKKIAKTTMAEAYIFPASGAAISGTVNTAIARANATSRAKAAAASLDVGGSITVTNNANSRAIARMDNLAPLSYASVGVMVGYAYADGTFEALVESNGGVRASGNVTVQNTYNASAEAVVNPAVGGVNVSKYSGKLNIGYAEVKTVANAGITGSGALAAKAVRVDNTGKAKANAEVKGGYFTGNMVQVLSNTVVARLNATQEAFVKNVFITADSVAVLSLYNVNQAAEAYNDSNLPVVPAIDTAQGAFALVGASYGKISLVDVTANGADANSVSTVRSYVQGAGANVSGALDVHTFAASYAVTNIDKPTAGVSLAEVGVAVLLSEAAGTYEAYIDSTGSEKGLLAGGIRVGVGHNTLAKSTTGPLGGTGVSLGGVAINVNQANANADASANAFVKGSGHVETTKGDLNVQVNGKAIADANIVTATVTINVIDVAANETNAALAVSQNAYLDLAGSAKVAGELTVRANFTDKNSEANAETGTPKGTSGVTITLISGSGTSAYATSNLTNNAYVNGTGRIDVGGKADVTADAVTKAIALVNKPFSAALAKVTVLLARAKSADNISAYISGVALNAAGAVNVKASGDTQAQATSASGGSASLISGSGGNSEALIGASGSGKEQRVTAYIGEDASVLAAGDITVEAKNTGSAKARMTEGFNITAFGVTGNIVPTTSYYYTSAYIGKSASVKSTGGSISVFANDTAKADTLVDGTSIGILVSADFKYATNYVSQATSAAIEENASLWAHGSIAVKANSNAELIAKTDANNGGLFAGGKLQSYNTLKRAVDVVLGKNANLFADFGSIEVISRAGESDSILTEAKSTTGTGFGGSSVKAVSEYESASNTTVNGGVTITNTFGNITIAAHTAADEVKTIGDIGMYAVGSDSDATAELTREIVGNNTLTAKVSLADGASERAVVTGRNVSVLASLKDLYIYNYTYASTGGFLNFAQAYSDINFMLNLGVTVGNAHIKAYDSMTIMADGSPTSSGTNLHAKAHTKITAFAGRVESYARLNGKTAANVTIQDGARLTGADVRIDRKAFNGTVSLIAEGTRRAIASEAEVEENKLQSTATTSVGTGVVFDIGDAAAGIAIDIYYDENGAVCVRSVGTPATFAASTAGVVILSNIRNNLPGKLVVVGNANGLIENVIYGQQYIPVLTITNRTNADLRLGAIDLYNETFTRATVNALNSANANVYNTKQIERSEDTTPEIAIISRGSGSVTMAGLVNNERGSLLIEWTEENGVGNGSLYSAVVTMKTTAVAPVWVHSLTVKNAKDVGTQTMRFAAYLTPFGGEDAAIVLSATGGACLELTLAEITPVSNLSGTLGTGALPGTLDIASVVAAGDLDVLLPTAIRMEYLADARAAQVIIPGVIQFTTETLNLGTLTLSPAQLERYLIGGQSDGYKVYTLPNGMQLYLDAAGNARRVISAEGRSFDTTLYSISGSVVTFHEYGVTLDLATGVLTALVGGDGFDLFVAQDGSGWYTINGTVTVHDKPILYKVAAKDGDGNITSLAETDVASLHLWKSQNGVNYYFLLEADYNNRTNGGYDKYYILAIESVTGYLKGVYEAGRIKDSASFSGSVSKTLQSETVNGDEKKSTYRYSATYQTNNLGGAGISIVIEIAQTVVELYNKGALSKTDIGAATLTKWLVNGTDATTWGAAVFNSGSLNGYRISKPGLKTDTDGIISGAEVSYSCIGLSTLLTPANITIYKAQSEGEDDITALGYQVERGGETLLVLPDTVYRYDDKNAASKDAYYELQAVGVKVEFETVNVGGILIPRIKVAREAKIHLNPGQQVTLKTFALENLNVYQLTRELHASADGTIVDVQRALDEYGVIQIVGAGTIFRYDLRTGSLQAVSVDAHDNATGSATYDKALGNVTLTGVQRLARLSENVAWGPDGNYYYYDGTQWRKAEASEANGIITVSYGGTTELTIHSDEDGVIFHTAYAAGKPLVQVGADGSVKWLDADSDRPLINSVEIPGTEYLISELKGSSVKLELKDPQGSLFDGDGPKGRPEDADITATAGNITIIAQSTGSIGTGADLIDMVTEAEDGQLILLDANGHRTVRIDTYTFVPEGDMVLDPLTKIVGAQYTLVTADGDIIGYDLIVENEGQQRGAFRLYTNHLEVRENGAVTGFAPNAAALSKGNIALHNILAKQGDLMFTAAGCITVEEDLAWYAENNAENYVTPIGITGVSSSFIWNAGSDIRAVNGIALTDSTARLAAKGSIRFDSLGSVAGTVELTTGSDIRFDSITGNGSRIALDAGRNIGMLDGVSAGEYGTRAYIKLAQTDSDANAALSLAATGDIASEQSRLIVDIPAALTLNVPRVHDLHIDALRLILGNRNAEDPTKYDEVEIGGTPVLAVDVATHPDNPKVNEFIGRDTNDHETKLDGDHLKWIEDQLLQALLESQTAGELAAWVMERAERGEWTAALAQAVVEMLLGAEDETAGLTAGFIAKLLGSERIAALLSEESRSTLAETAKRMNNAALSSVTDANEVAGRISAENRKRIFESLSEEEKLQAGLDPAAGTITAEKLAALLSGGSRLNLAAMKEYLDDAFLAQLALRADQTKAEGAVNAALAGGADVYRPLISAVAESDAAIPADRREKTPADAGYTVAYEDANKLLAILLGLQMSRAPRMDASGMPALDADGKPIWDEGPACIPALGEYLGSLLTEDDIERLYRQALNASVYPQEDADAGFIDPVPPAFNLHIGVSTGKTWLYNDGDINIVQEQGDLTVQNITSERGNVRIGTENGSILAAYTGGTHEGWHILGRDITLAASGEVGTKDAPLKLEQRENSPLIVEGVDEEMYFDSDYIAKVMQGLTDFTPDGTQKRYILRRVEQFNENGEAVLDENGAPALAWILDVVVRYDWIREDYPNPEPRMTLTVVAGGGAYVEELTGSVRGSIKAGGNAAYTVNGGEVGTYTDPLITDVDGTLIIRARNDISVKDLGNLDLVANSAKGQINAVAAGDIALKNTNGQNLVIGPVVAGGDAKIIADGALVEGNRYGQEAQVRANNITLQADGEIGTAQNPFDVDTRTGVLSAAGTELVLNEVSGNLTIKSIIATVGNVTITAPGSISEAGGAGKAVEDAAQDQQAANAAMDEADAANAQANVLDAYAVREEAKLNAAEDALKSAKEALLNAEKRIAEIEAVLRQAEAIRTDESLTEEERAALLGESTTEALSAEQANLLSRLPALQNALQAAQDAEAKQRAVAEPARDAADAAKAEAAAKQEAAVKAQTLADAARQATEAMQPAITLPGDLKLLAGGSIGTEQHPLSVGVSSTVDAEAPDGVYLAGFGDLAVARIETGADAVVNATGGLSGGNIHAEKAELNALGGSVGSREMPVALNVKELSGTARGEFHAVSAGDLAIGSVHAGGAAGIASSGSIAASGDAPSNITAEELSISAQGAVGTETALLRINAGNLTISGRGIYIKLIADVTIHTIEGGNIVIDADGNVWGDPETPQREYHIKGDSLDLDAFGSVGTKEVPLRIYIPGKVAVESEWGELHYRNHYVPYEGETSPAAPDVPTTGGVEAALAWCLTLLAAGLWAAARKRRIRKA